MNRDELIKRAAQILCDQESSEAPGTWPPNPDHLDDARAVLDAVLPQITTAEQLDEYPDGTLLLAANGRTLTLDSPYLTDLGLGLYLIPDALERYGPLIVVWQPS